jgi:hypothetical protein
MLKEWPQQKKAKHFMYSVSCSIDSKLVVKEIENIKSFKAKYLQS